jgi:hypothetical protein
MMAASTSPEAASSAVVELLDEDSPDHRGSDRVIHRYLATLQVRQSLGRRVGRRYDNRSLDVVLAKDRAVLSGLCVDHRHLKGGYRNNVRMPTGVNAELVPRWCRQDPDVAGLLHLLPDARVVQPIPDGIGRERKADDASRYLLGFLCRLAGS